VPAVARIIELEERLVPRSTGWTHESFIVARHIKPTLRGAGFSLAEFAGSLFFAFPDIDQLNLAVAKLKGQEDGALDFFCEIQNVHQFITFRSALGRLSFEHARIVLLFLFSGLRWRISRIPLKTCPFCPRHELLWRHFLECDAISPFLASEFLCTDLLLRYVHQNRWRDVFAFVGNVVGIWCDHLSTCALDVDTVWSLSHLP
jgi:hypothetical protein